jgi:zinc transport system permease protein
MDDFLLRAFAAGIGVSLVAGALGCFVVWRRMAYFGDALSHSALLGVTLGLVLGLDLNLGIIAACTLFALLLVALQRQQTLAGDTLLGILAHSALALGLVAIAVFDTPRVDLLAYLFGDILAVGRHDLYWIYGGGTLVLVGLAGLWRWLLALSVDEDLARVEGVPVGAVRLALMLLIAIVIAAAVKIVGVLLITSLLIIPAATARRFARSPGADGHRRRCRRRRGLCPRPARLIPVGHPGRPIDRRRGVSPVRDVAAGSGVRRPKLGVCFVRFAGPARGGRRDRFATDDDVAFWGDLRRFVLGDRPQEQVHRLEHFFHAFARQPFGFAAQFGVQVTVAAGRLRRLCARRQRAERGGRGKGCGKGECAHGGPPIRRDHRRESWPQYDSYDSWRNSKASHRARVKRVSAPA